MEDVQIKEVKNDFSSFILGSPEENATPYVPEGYPETWSAAYRPLGLPMDPMYNIALPGLEGADAAIEGTPILSSIQSTFDKITSDSYGALQSVYDSGKKAIGTLYDDVAHGVGNVYDDVTKPVTSLLDNVYWKVILAVVVVGGALYFIGKGGAVKVNV